MSDMLIHKTGTDDNGKVVRNLGKIKREDCEPGLVDAYYEHKQLTASDTWVINHNLGKEPSIDVKTSAGEPEFGGYITHAVNKMSSTIVFNYAFSGTAKCN